MRRFHSFPKILMTLVGIVSVFLLLSSQINNGVNWKINPNDTEFASEIFLELLPYSASLALEQPNGPVIHFLEGYGHTTYSNRMLCAIESACAANPNSSVIVHMKSPKLLWTPEIVQLLDAFINLRVVTLDQEELFKKSPLKTWYEQRRWQQSSWPVSHFNDAVRWLILYHYGGVYMDTDSISIRPLTPPSFAALNFVGLESNQWLGAGVIGLVTSHHWLPRLALESIANNFQPQEWGAMGPKLLTRVVSERCGLVMPYTGSSKCSDLTLLPREAFYNIPWWRYQRFVNPDRNHILSSKLLGNKSVYVVHIWNHLTQSISVPLNAPPTAIYRGDPETNRIPRAKEFPRPHSSGRIPSNLAHEKKSYSVLAVIAKNVCPITVDLAKYYL